MAQFRYLNVNPYGRKTGDCVIRATARALSIPWEEASDMLYNTARSIGCEMSCIGCYSALFRELGFTEITAEGKSVSALADSYKDNTLLIRIDGHLTCSVNGCIYDIWDCRDENSDRAWIV